MKLCSEIADPLEKLKDRINDAKIVQQLETEVHFLVSSVYKLKNEDIRKNWIESIREKIEEFVEKNSDDIGKAVLDEVKKCKQIVQNTLNGIDDTVYTCYEME